MNNAIYSNPGQNLCLTLWLQFTLETFNTNSSTRLNSMNLSGVIMSTKKDGHLKKMIFYILCSDTTSQIAPFPSESFLHHYGGQLKAAVEKETAEKIDCKR